MHKAKKEGKITLNILRMNLNFKGTKIILANFIDSARLVVTGWANFWDIKEDSGVLNVLEILKEECHFLKKSQRGVLFLKH